MRCLFLLERSLAFTAKQWRKIAPEDELPPLYVEPAVLALRRIWGEQLVDRTIFLGQLGPEGELIGEPLIVPGGAPITGVPFLCTFTPKDEVMVDLLPEPALQLFGRQLPRKQRVTPLVPWKPVRILLNGTQGRGPDRQYLLSDYHLLFCLGEPPAPMRGARLVDLTEQVL